MNNIAVEIQTEVDVEFLESLPSGTIFHEGDDDVVKSYLEIGLKTETKTGHLERTSSES